MNRYAQIALDQHQHLRPNEHARIKDPTGYFEPIGDRIQADVTRTRDEILGVPLPGETIEDYRLRSYQALRTAEDVALTDLFPPENEPTAPDLDEDDDTTVTRYHETLAAIHETMHAR